MTRNEVLLETNLPGLKKYGRGKVRDIYEDGDRLLIVATDRISAFDYILATGIPEKGRVLTQMTLFWLEFLRDLVPNHFLSTDVSGLPANLEGRSMWVRRAEMIQVECVARGYLSGSGWKDYQKTGGICGIALPAGLRESDALPEPVFTPATKAQSGHDENVSFDHVSSQIGADLTSRLQELTLALYNRAAEYARASGIIIADTKFEFGIIDGEITLADEVLTPDSSRFWPQDQYAPGGPQPSYDKQYVRDYLESIKWDKKPPAPALPDDVAQRTSQKYQEAYRVLTGEIVVNLLDLILVVIVGASIVGGFMAGFARVGIGFIATITGMLCGFWFYGIPAEWVHHYIKSQTASNLFGFFIVFFGCVIAGSLIAALISRLFKWTGLSWLDRLLGGAFGVVRGSLIAVAFIAVLMAFTPKPTPNWMVDSKVLPYAIDASNVCAALAPNAIKEAFRESMNDIRKVWEEQLKKKHKKDPEQLKRFDS